jgi:hypothetical protein
MERQPVLAEYEKERFLLRTLSTRVIVCGIHTFNYPPWNFISMTKNFRDDWCEADVGRVPQPPFVQRHLVQGPLLVVTSDRLGVNGRRTLNAVQQVGSILRMLL